MSEQSTLVEAIVTLEVQCLSCGRRAWRKAEHPGLCATCGGPCRRTGRFSDPRVKDTTSGPRREGKREN